MATDSSRIHAAQSNCTALKNKPEDGHGDNPNGTGCELAVGGSSRAATTSRLIEHVRDKLLFEFAEPILLGLPWVSGRPASRSRSASSAEDKSGMGDTISSAIAKVPLSFWLGGFGC